MKKKSLILLLALSMVFTTFGCGKDDDTSADTNQPVIVIDDLDTNTTTETETAEEVPTEVPTPTEEPEETKEGYFRSDLTNCWIEDSLANIRPLAIMVPNNSSALPQYEISKAGVVYECLAEGKISRLMCVFDDYRDMERIGNVRSARAYYVYWALEWDPIFFHCGNVLYADPILNADACDNINCVKTNYGWYRVSGENRIYEQTLYASSEKIDEAIDKLGYSKTHTQYYQPGHWNFVSEKKEIFLDDHSDAIDVTKVDCKSAFPNDKPWFEYDAETGLFKRFEFGEPHIDAANDNAQLAFKNLVIQYCDYSVLDEYDHLEYKICGGGEGYYMTNGKAVPVTWSKNGDLAPTKFYYKDGTEVTFNTGKTMVCVAAPNCPVTIE